MRETLVSIPAR
uniref:Uncharacterized protein n=1 Tax=Anguilla anguilla TaxID=7936 RepID=A0A0E9VZH2_ANGAN